MNVQSVAYDAPLTRREKLGLVKKIASQGPERWELWYSSEFGSLLVWTRGPAEVSNEYHSMNVGDERTVWIDGEQKTWLVRIR